MAASSIIGALRVNLGLDSANFANGLRKSAQQAKGFQSDMLAIGAKIGGALAAAFSLRAMGQAADAWSDMSSRVGIAISDMERAPEVMERIQEIAQMTYSPLQQTADGFVENAAALKEYGYSISDSLDYTEALNNALVVSGAKGERAASVARALSVAMATGKLSGDGLNTILSNGGRIAEVLAKELGTTRNGLIKMASEGKITGSVIASALLGNMEALRDEAAEMPATIADGFQRIGNSFTGLIGRMDQASGVSATLAAALVGISDIIDSLAAGLIIASQAISAAVKFLAELASSVASSIGEMTGLGAAASYVSGMFGEMRGYVIAAALAVAAYFTPAFLAATVQVGALIASLVTLRGALIATGIGAIVIVVGTLINKVLDLVKATGGWGEAFSLLGEVAAGVWEGIVTAAGAIVPGLGYVWATIKSSFYSLIESLSQKWLDFISFIALNNPDTLGGYDIFRDIVQSASKGVIDAKAALAGAQEEAAESSKEAAEAIAAGAGIAAEALAKLNVSVDETTDSLGGDDGLGGALDNTGGKAGGAGKKLSKFQEIVKTLREEAERLKATLNMTDLQAAIWGKQREAGVSADSAQGKEIAALMSQVDGLEKLKESADKGRDAMKDLFGSALDGANAFKQALGNLFAEMAKAQFTKGIMGLFGGTSWGAGLMSGIGNLLSYEGGGYSWDGPRTGGVDGRGGRPVLLHPQETVIDHTKGQGFGSSRVTVEAAPNPYFDLRVTQISQAGDMRMADTSRRALPGQIRNAQVRGLR